MKRSVPENLFELEPIEQRILLSGDSLLVGLQTSMPDEPEDLFAADLALPPSVAGNYAYVADDGNRLHVIDISDPKNPSVVGEVIPMEKNCRIC